MNHVYVKACFSYTMISWSVNICFENNIVLHLLSLHWVHLVPRLNYLDPRSTLTG